MTSANTIPKAVSRSARQWEQAVGTRPAVTVVEPGLWRLTLKNKRITATQDWRGSLGKTKFAGASLTVDGKPRPVLGHDEFVKLWKSHGDRTVARPAVLMDVPPGGDLATAPTTVQDVAGQLARAGIEAQAGFAHNRWIISFSLPDDGGGMRLVFTSRKRQWGLSWGDSQVIVGGEDVTRQVGGDIAKALQMLFPSAPGAPAAPSTGPIAREAGPAVTTNAVSIRRQTVIRT
jgi:hypothetical protein